MRRLKRAERADISEHFPHMTPRLLTRAELLDFGELRLEAIVDPGQHVVARQILRRHVCRVNVNSHDVGVLLILVRC